MSRPGAARGVAWLGPLAATACALFAACGEPSSPSRGATRPSTPEARRELGAASIGGAGPSSVQPRPAPKAAPEPTPSEPPPPEAATAPSAPTPTEPAPAEPTAAPTEPTAAPTEPTAAPAEPTPAAPTELDAAPAAELPPPAEGATPSPTAAPDAATDAAPDAIALTPELCATACGNALRVTLAELPEATAPTMRLELERALMNECPTRCLERASVPSARCIATARTALELAACP